MNRFLRPKVERAFSAHVPGAALRLGALHYDFWKNRLGCDSVALTRADGAPARAGLVSAVGVHWGRLLTSKPNPAQILRNAQVEVTDLSAALPDAEYRVQCGHLRISVPDSVIAAQALTLRLTVSDETYFAASAYRRVRYRVTVPTCSLRGVGFAELLNGQRYRAQTFELPGLVFETLINFDKPRRPVKQSPPMPSEMLAAIPKPFRIDRLTITDGLIKGAGRRAVGAEPGVLTVTALQISVKDIANGAAGGQAVAFLGEGKLMDAGTLTVQMRLPIAPSALAFHSSGKLSAMDLTRLDEFMDGSGRIQIKSGSESEVSFDIDVTGGHASGAVRGAYRDLQVTVVDRDTGSERGIANRAATILTNSLKVRKENRPDKAGALKAGKVDYARKPEENFLQFAWLAFRSGIFDLVSPEARPIP